MKIFLSVLAVVLVIFVGFLVFNRPSVNPLGSQLGQFNFNSVTTDATSSVGTGGALVITGAGLASSSFTSSVYWSIQNYGTSSIACFPSATTTGFSYPGGWVLYPSSTAFTSKEVGVYNGSISCVSAAGTDTVGIIAR